MGYVLEKRAESLLQQVLLSYLNKGVVPTVDQLEDGFKKASKAHGPLTRSSIRSVTLPPRWTESSSSNMRDFVESFQEDLWVILSSLVEITNENNRNLVGWNSRAASLQARLSSLKGRIDSLLLLNSDAAGYLAFVEDGFFSLESVSSDTTADIDTTTGEVTLGIDKEASGLGESQGTRVDLSSSTVNWGLISGNNVRLIEEPHGSNISKILDDHLNGWRAKITGKRGSIQTRDSSSGVVAEIKIQLGIEQEISRISMVPNDSTAGSPSVVSALYSIDGYSWERVNSPSHTQSGTESFVWRFPKTRMNFIKFIISKNSPDEVIGGEPVFDIGINYVKVFSEIYSVDTDGVQLVSELLTPLRGGEDVSFGRASLEVCDEIPEQASIKYYLRAYDGSSYTSWVNVIPLSDSGQLGVVDFSSPQELISEDLTTSFDSSLNVESVNTLRNTDSGTLSYRLEGANETVANFYIPVSEGNLTDLKLTRNIGYSAGKFPTLSSDLKVADVEIGWGLKTDGIYYTHFWVKNPDGLPLNFGDTQAKIDGRVVSGEFLVAQGWHYFETARENWFSITGTAPTTEDGLRSIDPRYPNNHKYLIEGYNYPDGFTGKRVYTGCDEYGQYRSDRVGLYSLHSMDSLDAFALDTTTDGKTIFIFRFDSSRPNHKNERVRLHYTRRFSSFTGIQFKAILSTKDAEVTPSLSYYRVRVK